MEARPLIQSNAARRRRSPKLCLLHPTFGINAALGQILDVVGWRLLALVGFGVAVSLVYCYGAAHA